MVTRTHLIVTLYIYCLVKFDVLLTAHLSIILVINPLALQLGIYCLTHHLCKM